MATVIFYEKPGCVNNTRQKQLLTQSGHQVVAKNLLAESWTPGRLEKFFYGHPLENWFNRSAPRIKSGEVVPETLSAEQAFALMIEDPLLIRRPLMQVNEQYCLGFDPGQVNQWIGLQAEKSPDADLENCPREHAARPCAVLPN